MEPSTASRHPAKAWARAWGQLSGVLVCLTYWYLRSSLNQALVSLSASREATRMSEKLGRGSAAASGAAGRVPVFCGDAFAGGEAGAVLVLLGYCRSTCRSGCRQKLLATAPIARCVTHQ